MDSRLLPVMVVLAHRRSRLCDSESAWAGSVAWISNPCRQLTQWTGTCVWFRHLLRAAASCSSAQPPAPRLRPSAQSRAMAFQAASGSACRPRPRARSNSAARRWARWKRRNTGAHANVSTRDVSTREGAQESAHAHGRIGPCRCALKYCEHEMDECYVW